METEQEGETEKQERVAGLTKNFTKRDLAPVKNTRDLLDSLRGKYFHTGYIFEHLDLVQAEIELNLAKFGREKGE